MILLSRCVLSCEIKDLQPDLQPQEEVTGPMESPLNALSHQDQDRQLSRRLAAITAQDPDFWAFRRNATRKHAHAYFRYPAMMVPQMQAALLDELCAIDSNISHVYDPFVGSGTVLTEAMLKGLSFSGCDINPLAVLLCRVKSGPFFIEALESRWRSLRSLIESDHGTSIEARFPGRSKWFNRGVAIRLSRIVRAIRTEEHLWSRRFFWIALSETVRLSSNSRTSTFKLHIRPRDEIESRSIDPLAVFEEIVGQNLERARQNAELLRAGGLLERGLYKGNVIVKHGSASRSDLTENESLADALITSPPYGDNVTTVPYGQHSYLPLQWIDLGDIDPAIDNAVLSSTHEIDSQSLGGSRHRALSSAPKLCERSPTLALSLKALERMPRDRSNRVVAFWRDLDACLSPILNRLRPNAYMVWVVGSRRVGQLMVPMHQILSELLASRGAVSVALLERRIPSKRMAIRNDIAETMSSEQVLVMRKGASNV